MKVMPQLKTTSEDDLPEEVEEALLKQRGNNTITTTRTISDGRTLTAVYSISSTSASASSSSDYFSAAADLDNSVNIDEPIPEEAGNEDNEEENSEYWDKTEDKWKCRHCTWTYQNGFPWVDHIHSKPINFHSGEMFADTRVKWSKVSVRVDDLAGKLNGCGDIQVLSAEPVENLTGPIREEPDTAATGESDGEELILEFEAAVHKMHTHNDYNMYCPNCSRQIIKVVLRRSPPEISCGDLFGCLSCLRIFECIGNRLNVLGICGRREPQPEPVPTEPPSHLIIPVPRPEIPNEPGSSISLDIVKSIVYGGLLESIASLGVVSSAAAADATTLNIVALGLGNLVGGLVVLVHNLRDLRFGKSNKTNEERYKEELGKKEHFLLHATVAMLSYIIFGLIPPVIYGFTFRETNDRDFKMLAVAAAAFLCIFILAIAKVYGRGVGRGEDREEHPFKAYFKTVLYYLTSAIVASGVAFAVGDLAKKVIEKLGWLDSATVEPRSFQSTWASY